MTAMLRRVGEFEPEREDWTYYVERLECFFDANGIEGEGKKRSVFLAVNAAYRLLRSLLAPGKPGEKTFSP